MEYFQRQLITSSKFYLAVKGMYGMSFPMGFLMSKHLGIHPRLPCSYLDVNSVSYKKFLSFITLGQNDFGDPLKREMESDIDLLIDHRTYRGTRHKHAYPSRGQRTRSNAKTKKLLFKTYSTLYTGRAKSSSPSVKNKDKDIE